MEVDGGAVEVEWDGTITQAKRIRYGGRMSRSYKID